MSEQRDVTRVFELGVAFGISAALGLMGQRKIETLRRLDGDRAFIDRVCKLVAQHALYDTAGRDPTQAEYLAMIDSIARMDSEPTQ